MKHHILNRLAPAVYAYAHCDLPCGVYDPAQARIEAESVKACMEKYNASDAYALAVAFLGEILAGRPAIVAPWPADEEMLDRDDAVRLQEMLRDRGLYDGAIDGLLGSGSRAAVARYQERHGLIADGHPDRTLMTHIEQNSVRATPPLQGWDSGRP
jgi:hypothetical protein